MHTINYIDDILSSFTITASSADRVKPKTHKIGMCCFSEKHATLMRKSKDWLARNQDNISERGDISIRGLLFR